MLCRVLMERLPAHVDTIYLATPSLASDEILHAIADDLDLKLSQERRTVALRELQEELIGRYAAGRRVVILIDEAHAMPDDTLEQVRLLSNLESNRHKLLQIVLFGQPELDATLAKASLRQLRDRITHAFRMRPLSSDEVTRYLSFRMRAAGYRGPEVFIPRASALVARASGGLTRRINILADKALLAAFTHNTHAVTDRHVRAAVADSEFAAVRRPARPAAYVAAALAAGLAIGAAIPWWLSMGLHKAQPPRAQVASIPPAAAGVLAPQPLPAASNPAFQPEPLLSQSQLRRLGGYSPAGQKLLEERLAAARERLERAPDEHFGIELFVTDNPDAARMERFLVRARDMVPLAELLVIPMERGGRYRLRVVLGEFADREQAQAAERRLPPKYQQAFRSAPRSFAELREQI
jgi:MSHA biogenesis protein MshM